MAREMSLLFLQNSSSLNFLKLLVLWTRGTWNRLPSHHQVNFVQINLHLIISYLIRITMLHQWKNPCDLRFTAHRPIFIYVPIKLIRQPPLHYSGIEKEREREKKTYTVGNTIKEGLVFELHLEIDIGRVNYRRVRRVPTNSFQWTFGRKGNLIKKK